MGERDSRLPSQPSQDSVPACLAAVLLDWGAWWEKALCVGLLAPFVVGVLLALRQRLKEIKGGEEDAASQY